MFVLWLLICLRGESKTSFRPSAFSVSWWYGRRWIMCLKIELVARIFMTYLLLLPFAKCTWPVISPAQYLCEYLEWVSYRHKWLFAIGGPGWCELINKRIKHTYFAVSNCKDFADILKHEIPIFLLRARCKKKISTQTTSFIWKSMTTNNALKLQWHGKNNKINSLYVSTSRPT